MKHIVLYIGFLCFFAINTFGQKNIIKQADNALKANEYTFAINTYKSVFSQIENEDPQKATIAYKIGWCYRHISQPLHAQLWFDKAIELRYEDPIVYFYCAEAMRMNKNFDKAIQYYDKYKSIVRNDNRAAKGIESCRIARKWLQEPTNYTVTNLAFINSEYSDYAPFFDYNGKSKTIYFSSSRNNATGDKVHGGSGQSFSDIYSSNEDAKGFWTTPVSVSDQINTENEEGAASISKDGNQFFFTQCKVGNQDFKCKIKSAAKIGSSWDSPVDLQLSESKDTSDYVHPCISADGLTLYFASNRVGGYGGYDIWFCKRESKNDKWGKPQNAGDIINTEGDELYPYIRQYDNTFYFASNGHIGMGGLDLYRVNIDEKGKQNVLNLKNPINSPSDDFGITFKDSLEEGFFSSNRPGGKGYDDIYHFSIAKLKFSVKGQVLSEISETPIANATVSLIGSDGTSLEVISDANGNYEFTLNPQVNYVLLSMHEGYLNSKYKISTYGRTEDKHFEANLYMTQLNIPIEVPNVMYDVNLWNLRPESIVSLNKLYETLEDNPNITIELSSHTDYRVGPKMSNEQLSQLRAQSVVDFLINKGIDKNRLVAKGYGATVPKTVDQKYADQYDFLHVGDKLTPEFIQHLSSKEQQDICHQINRRTEFKVTSTNYKK